MKLKHRFLIALLALSAASSAQATLLSNLISGGGTVSGTDFQFSAFSGSCTSIHDTGSIYCDLALIDVTAIAEGIRFAPVNDSDLSASELNSFDLDIQYKVSVAGGYAADTARLDLSAKGPNVPYLVQATGTITSLTHDLIANLDNHGVDAFDVANFISSQNKFIVNTKIHVQAANHPTTVNVAAVEERFTKVVSTVSEPASLSLLGVGLAAAGLGKRSSRKAR
jgi:hypothetical protein